MHTHNTLPNVAQKYHLPIWELPDNQALNAKDQSTIRVNREAYERTKEQYIAFAKGVIERIKRHEE